MSSNFLSVASVIEANRLDSDVPILVLLQVELANPDTGDVMEIIRIVRNPEAVVFNGEVFDAANFDIEIKHESGKPSSFSATVLDYTQAITQMLEAYKGGVGSNVTLYIAPADGLDRPPELEENFQITAVSSADYRISFTLGAENALARPFPSRRQTRDFCQWRYKDPDTCAYTGSLPTCDLTLKGANGCSVHGNAINFGAFRGINSNGRRYV